MKPLHTILLSVILWIIRDIIIMLIDFLRGKFEYNSLWYNIQLLFISFFNLTNIIGNDYSNMNFICVIKNIIIWYFVSIIRKLFGTGHPSNQELKSSISSRMFYRRSVRKGNDAQKVGYEKNKFLHSIWLYSCYEVWFCSVWSWKEGYHKETKIKLTMISNNTFKYMIKELWN